MQVHEVLFTRTQRAVLGLYLLNPTRRFHVREVVRRVQSGHGAVQNEIRKLWKIGLLNRYHQSNRVEYQANVEHFVFNELQALLDRTIGPAGQLHQALEPIRTDIDLAFLYGSTAAHAMTQSSDIDLLIVGAVSFAKVTALVTPLQDSIGREINPTVFAPDEFVRRIQAGDPFLRTITAGPKIFLVGDARELARLA